MPFEMLSNDESDTIHHNVTPTCAITTIFIM